MLTNLKFLYFIYLFIFILPTVFFFKLFEIFGTAKRHGYISAHFAWDRWAFVMRPPCCVTCACSCMTYSWRRGSKLSTSKWDTQTDVHDLLIWLSWSRWFLFISGFSWFGMSRMENRHREHTRRGRLCFAVGTGIKTADFDQLILIWLKTDE